MNYKTKFLIILAAINLLGLGCGVKGDPQPPLEPPFIGRGEPTYDNAGSELVDESNPTKKKKKSR